MKIKCALSPNQIKNLYSNVYGNMVNSLKNDTPFDVNTYMGSVFDKISKKSGPENAAKFIQQIPKMVSVAANREDLFDLEIDLNAVRKLVKEFANEDTGIESVMKRFAPKKSASTKKDLTNKKANKAFDPEQSEDKPAEARPLSLKPFSIFNTSYQEFEAIDPRAKDEGYQDLQDETKEFMYTALEKIAVANTDVDNAMDTTQYQGKELRLKPVVLASAPVEMLDKYSTRIKNVSAFFRNSNKKNKNVIQATEIILMAISDEQGKLLYFDNEGNIVESPEQGRVVYQFLRNVILEDGKYKDVNIYGYYNQIASPSEISKATGVPIEEVVKNQQADFKALYDYKKSILDGNEALAPLTGVSQGVSPKQSKQIITLANLNQFPFGSDSVFRSINTISTPRGIFKEGNGVITIEGVEYKIDRPNVSDDIINKIADVFSNPNISNEEKYNFYMQFFSEKAHPATRRHNVEYAISTDELIFSYSPTTYAEKYSKFEPIANLNTPEAKDLIFNVLKFASGTKGKYFSAKMNYDNTNLSRNGFQDYDLATRTLNEEFSNYIELLKTLERTTIDFSSSSDPKKFNAYMSFRIPDEFVKKLEEAKKNPVSVEPSPTRKQKNILVNYLKGQTETVTTDVSKQGKVNVSAAGNEFGTFSITSPVTGESLNVSLDKKFFKEASDLVAGTPVSLALTTSETDDMYIPDVIEVKNAEGKTIGRVMETDYSKESSLDNYYRELKKQRSKTTEEKIEESTNTKGTANPKDGLAGKFFLRDGHLQYDATPEQVKKADSWWKISDLNKYLDFEQGVAIANSDAFARFIAYGSILNGKLGMIQIGNKGSMVDVYHEAWHGFSQLFLTPEQKIDLYKEVQRRLGKNKKLSFFDIEEILAEDFRTYAKNPKAAKDSPVRNSIFRRILNFLKELLGIGSVTNVTDIKKVREYYENLYFNKNLNQYTPSIDNVMFDLLNRNSGVQTLADENIQALNRQDATTVKNSMDVIISKLGDNLYSERKEDIQQLGQSKSATTKLLEDPRNRNALYTYIFNELDTKRIEFQDQLDQLEDTPENFLERQKLENNIRIITAALDNWGNQSNGMIQYHIENSNFNLLREKFVEMTPEQEDAVEVEDTDPDTEPTAAEDTERVGDKKIGDRSLLELADKEVVYILKSLFKKDRSGKVILNELGFEELVDFTSTWNNVVRTIRGEQDPTEQYKLLKDAIKIHPEFEQLVDFKLADPETSNNLYEAKATTAFWQTFSKPRVPLLQSTIYPNGITQITEASIEAVDILRGFENKFRADINNPFIIRREEDNVPMLALQALVEEFSDKNGNLDNTKYYDFARRLGIYLDDLSIIKRELKKNQKAVEEYGLPYIFKTVQKVAKLEANPKATEKQLNFVTEFKKNPIYYLRTEIPAGMIADKAETQKYKLKNLAELQARYGLDTSNFGVLNAEGNIVFELIEKSTASKIAYAINKATKLSDLWNSPALKYMSYLNPAINTFTNNSRFLKTIFDFNDPEFTKRSDKELELFMSSGTQQIISEEFGTKEGLNTTSLDSYSKFLQEMNSMLKSGVQEFIRHASKSSAFGLRIDGGIIGGPGKLDSDPRLWIDLDMFAKGTSDSYALRTHLVPYIASEANRIYKFRQNRTKFEQYVGYNNETASGEMAGEVFTAFDNVLTPSTKDDIYSAIDNAIANKEYFDFISFIKADQTGLADKISKDVLKYFDELTNENYAMLQQTNYISPDTVNKLKVYELSKEDQDKLLTKAYTFNSWIHNFETINLMYGDMAQYNHVKEELHKRNTGLTSTGRAFRTDLAAQNLVKGALREESYAKKKGFNYVEYDGTFNTAIIQDIERSSVYLPVIEKALIQDYTNKLKETIKDPAKLAEAVEYRVKNDLDAYKKMTEGDGQGWITFDAYRILKNLENDWSYEQQELFDKVTDGEFVSPAEIIQMFPVYKVQNFGHLANTELPVNAMHKFALAPLVPSMIEGSDLQSLHEQMMKDNIQYVTFQSGSKVGSVTSEKDSKGKAAADIIYADGEMKSLKRDIKFTPNTIYLDYLKNVTNVNSAYKEKAPFSTQLRKLILGSMYREGKIINPNNEATVKQYEKTVDEYTKLLKFELLTEIGYEEVDGKYIGNLTNFLDLVQRELGRKNLPEHHIEFVGQNLDSTLKTDLSLHLRADEIEKILVSLIEKRFIKQKVKGESLVQVSSSMTNGMWSTPTFQKATDEDIRKFIGTNNLPFYNPSKDGTSAMKVAIALQGDFTKLLRRRDIAVYDTIDGQRILNKKASLAKLNERIKDDEWVAQHRDLIRMSAVRIPVQGLNSMEFMEVYEFLDPAASNIIITPTEIVAKSGADFDVDKLITFMPNIDNRGTFIESGMSEEQFQNFVKRNKENKDRVKETIKTQKAALENRLITSINNILALPDNYANLVRPNSTYLLKDIADKLQDFVSEYDRFKNKLDQDYYTKTKDGKTVKYISPTRTLETGYNIHKHEVNLTGKTVLGITAVENALNPILNSLGAAMPKTYKHSYYDNATKKWVETDTTYNTNLYLPHRKMADGRVSLSHTESLDGDSIADVLSQMMNGLVDVEKDAWIFFIQGNLEVAPTLLYLIKAGVPKEHAIMFVSNPLIRDYARNQRLYKSSYANVAGKTLDDKSYAQYQAATDVIQSQLPTLIEDQLSSIKDTETIYVRTGSFNPYLQEMKYETLPMTKWQLIEKVKDKRFAESFINVRKGSEKGSIVFNKPSTSNKKYYNDTKFYTQEYVNKEKEFDLDLMKRVIVDPKSPKYRGAAMAMFMHFVEIEKQIRGLQALKRLANPDTRTSKTLEEVIRRGVSLEELKELSKVDPELVRKLVGESILGSFFDNKLIGELVRPLFPLRNNDKVTNYVINLLQTKAGSLVSKYGSGPEATRAFISEYKNSIVNYVFQNYMSNFIDGKGNIVNVPTEYKEMPVKTKKGVRNGVEIIDNVVYVDEARISKDYAEKLFAAESEAADSYRARGLRPFRAAENVFPTKSSFFKYVVEREYQRSMIPLSDAMKNKTFRNLRNVLKSSIQDINTLNLQTYEAFLNQRAMIFAFNREALMQTVNYSYSDQLMGLIREFSDLKDKYPVLNQLTKPSLKTGEKVISLNDSRMLKDPQLAEIYYQNIKDLGDPTVKKVASESDNERISEMFGILPLAAIYQHGIGYSRFGFNEALPYDKFLDVMDSASQIFLEKQLNNATLRNIYDKLMDPKNKLFKDFVVSPEDFNNPTDTPLEPEVATEETDVEEEVVITPPSTSVKPSDFTNYHGGAKKYDTYWEQDGKTFGVTKHTVYTVDSYDKLDQATKDKLNAKYDAARTWLGRSILSTDTYAGKLVRRDMMQAAKADGIFAVSEIVAPGTKGRKGYVNKTNHPIIEGGTGYAVASGILLGKPVYVFNQDSNYGYDTGWYKWDSTTNNFIKTDTPVLTKNYAGIGSSTNETEIGRQAIRDVYANTFKSTQPSTINTLSENIKNFVNSVIPNWIDNKNNELQLVSEFKTIQLLSQEESSIKDRISFGEEAETIIKEGLRGKDVFVGTTFKEQIPNLLYAVISGKLAKDGISEADMYSNIFKNTTQEQPDQNAPDGLPPIDRSIDSCS
jgi:predicted lactoylglutathione lyase